MHDFFSDSNPEFKEIAQKISEKLNLEVNDLKKGFERKIITKYEYKGKKYLCFKKKLKTIERGTVVFLNDNFDFIMGYPKIRRAMVLESTLNNYFDNFVAVEEKLDGYNIRIVKFEGEILAITRGGKICPFTTKKVKKYINTKFLDDYPELMLCGEMIGLNNPYVNHYYPEVEKEHENLGFYIFDIREKETNTAHSIYEKEKLLEKYGIPYVKPIKIIKKSEMGEFWDIIDNLNKNHREGVVLKDPEMIKNPIKYTTHYTQCNDLSIAFTYTYDIGIDFMFSRLVREGYQSFEKCETKEEMEKRAEDLGKAILLPMIETIKDVSKNNTSKECFELIFDLESDFLEFVDYLKKMHIVFTVESKESIGNHIKVKICRIYSSTTDIIKSHLDGNPW